MQQKGTLVAPDKALETSQEKYCVRPIDPELPAPNFFIVGAAKAGTTSIYAYLSKHPDVFMSALKEPHYFASFEMKPKFDNFMPVIRDSRAYQELFTGSGGYNAVGEASPSYLCDADSAERIKSAIPNAKIVISLRNPVQRAYSQYLMDYNKGFTALPFAEALKEDEACAEKGWGVSFQYIEHGLYAEQVERYLNVFGRSNVLVILFEDLIRETAIVMREVARFIGVDPEGFPESTFERVHNPYEASRGAFARAVLRYRPIRVWSKRWVPLSFRTAVRNHLLFRKSEKPKLENEIRRVLGKRFAPDLERLEQLLERDLGVLKERD
jgi:hypothetical protein